MKGELEIISIWIQARDTPCMKRVPWIGVCVCAYAYTLSIYTYVVAMLVFNYTLSVRITDVISISRVFAGLSCVEKKKTVYLNISNFPSIFTSPRSGFHIFFPFFFFIFRFSLRIFPRCRVWNFIPKGLVTIQCVTCDSKKRVRK